MPQDARNAGATDRPKAPGGPSVWDAARAIEDMEAEKERQREAAATSGAANVQLAQNTQGGGAAAEPDEFTDEHWLKELAFQNTCAWEQGRSKIYYDSNNVPTVGCGYALVFNDGSDWVLRSDADLATAGIALPQGDKTRLGEAADFLNGKRINKPNKSKYELSLDADQHRKIFDLKFPEYLRYAKKAVNTEVDGRYVDRFSYLRPEQQSALFDLAYMGPRNLINHSDRLRTALDADRLDRENDLLARRNPDRPSTYWDRTGQVIDSMFGGDNSIRSHGNGDLFRYPTAEHVYQVQPNDNPTTIASKIGMTLQEFLQRYPEYASGSVRSGERIYFDPTYRSDLRGRIP